MQDLVWAEISLAALKNNFEISRLAAPAAKIIAVIKADAYGHGALTVAENLPDTDYFAVAKLDKIAFRISGVFCTRTKGQSGLNCVHGARPQTPHHDTSEKRNHGDSPDLGLVPTSGTPMYLQLMISKSTSQPKYKRGRG